MLQVKRLFDSIDVDYSKSIDLEEFSTTKWAKREHVQDNVVSMFQSLDLDASGTLEIDEFLKVIFPKASAADLQKMIDFLEGSNRVPSTLEHQLTKEQVSEVGWVPWHRTQ